METLSGSSSQDVALHQRLVDGFGLWNSNYRYALPDFKLVLKNTDTETDMTKIERNLFFFAIVDAEDKIDLQSLVAENEQIARDIIVQDRLGEGVKAKDVEIVIVNSMRLKPRTEKDA